MGVVQMKSIEVGEADDLIEFLQRLFPARRSSDVVAGDEDMASVDANADRDFSMQIADDLRDVLEPVPDACPLTGCRF